MPYRLSAVLGVVALALAVAVPASAFDCTVAKKPAKAGSVGLVDTATGEFTPSKNNPGTEERPHGGFVELQFGEPAEFGAGSDRKLVTRRMEGEVRRMMSTALRDARRPERLRAG